MYLKNAGTATFFTMIDELGLATTGEKLESVLGNAVFMERINSPQWLTTQSIKISNKHLLIAELLYDELVRKQESQLCSLVDGLKFASFYDYMLANPIICKKLFRAKTSLCPKEVFMEAIIKAENTSDA